MNSRNPEAQKGHTYEQDSDLLRVLHKVARDIHSYHDHQRGLLVAVDGVDGSGKSVFAKTLAEHLQQDGLPVFHTSVDGFHKPRAERYVRGRHSPEGFFYDSYDYDRFQKELLLPFGAKEDRYVRAAIHDVETDAQLQPDLQLLLPGTVVIIDGIFLHRDELVDYWDYSLFLDVDFEQTFQRMALRDGCPPDPNDESNRRYREGQLLYFQTCSPKQRATVVIDNTDYEHPAIIY